MANVYVLTCENDNKVFLVMVSPKEGIQAFKEEKAAFNYFEKGYQEYHSMGYQASMSALISYIQTSPKVHEVSEDIGDLMPLIGENPLSIARYSGLTLLQLKGDADKIRAFRESGKSVSAA